MITSELWQYMVDGQTKTRVIHTRSGPTWGGVADRLVAAAWMLPILPFAAVGLVVFFMQRRANGTTE